MIQKQGVYFGRQCILACDGKCHKAWGICNRPKNKLSEDNIDDYEWLSDDELGIAPEDPGTYEGFSMVGKPIVEDEKLNKWCVRECERSDVFALDDPIELKDFSKRISNINKG